MMDERWIRVYRMAFGVLTLVAIAYQAGDLADQGAFRPGNFFSFFTIQSNLFAAVVLLWGATRDPERRDPAAVDLVRGAATLYLSITGIVVAVLLSGMQEGLAVPVVWVDDVVHQIIPIVMVADWLIVPPTTRIAPRRVLIWIVYPLLYATYSLLRGTIVDWYPYPFLNPDHAGGYGVVALYVVGLTVSSLLVGWLVVFVGNRLRPPAARA